MERDIKEGVKRVMDEYITNRKAMFIPIAAVASFMLVGYAATDKEKPEIISNQIDLVYGEEFDADSIDISDNKDSREDILVSVETASLNEKQIGSYDVEVTATDAGSNVATKTVTVNVVDNEAPKIETLGSSQGYIIEVPINGSADLASYVKASDNVDGDVTPFIKSSETLNTTVKGQQDITLTVDDTSGNTTEETYTFVVSDLEAPVVNFTQGANVTVDYGSVFDINAYVNVTDNVDGVMAPVVEGSVDTLKLDETQPLKISATDSSGNPTEATLNVVVKDISAPVITLNKSEITVNTGESVDFSSYLASAVDNKDGDVRANVQIDAPSTSKAGTKTATYTVTDAAGNTGTASLTVKVNKRASGGGSYAGSAPVITLNKSEITVNTGESVDFSSYLASAVDNKDGDVRANVQIDAPSTSKAGTKTATYTVTDAAGNTGTASLTVKVNKRASGGGSYAGSAPSNSYGNTVLSAAYSRLGCPYKWGAAGPNAFDCSGFVQWCYARAGVSLPHSSSAQKNAGTQISVSAAQPGDILWKSGHVGIYIGNGKYIHAPQTGDVVKISSVSGSGFVCAVRVK